MSQLRKLFTPLRRALVWLLRMAVEIAKLFIDLRRLMRIGKVKFLPLLFNSHPVDETR